MATTALRRRGCGICAHVEGWTEGLFRRATQRLFGDMALIGEFFKPELAFLPIGDHFTMGPDQAAHAARMLKVKSVIPMHYGTFPALTGTPRGSGMQS